MPSIANPYGRQTDSNTTQPPSQWNSPGVAAPQNSQAPVIAPGSDNRQNSNPAPRQGSAVPRNDGAGQQGSAANGQSSNGGGAQAGAARQAPSGGGVRQRHP